jgi:hypothetical protein
VEARLALAGSVFVDDMKHEALAPQVLPEKRKKALWEMTTKLLEANPRVNKREMFLVCFVLNKPLDTCGVCDTSGRDVHTVSVVIRHIKHTTYYSFLS